jgi:hypothetical protein
MIIRRIIHKSDQPNTTNSEKNERRLAVTLNMRIDMKIKQTCPAWVKNQTESK